MEETNEHVDWESTAARPRTIESVADLGEALRLKLNLSLEEDDRVADEDGAAVLAPVFVWRGVADRTWPLHSGLYRRVAKQQFGLPTEADLRRIETAQLLQARKAGYGNRSRGDLSDLELLALLQHFGGATRLLDVTRNVLVALWFACDQGTSGKGVADGALFGIDVAGRTLNERHERRTIQQLTNRPGLWHWEPPPIEQRIRAQQSAFVFSRIAVASPSASTRVTSLELEPTELDALKSRLGLSGRRLQSSRTATRPLVVFHIPSRAKRAIRAELAAFYGQDERTIYPDLAGFARSWSAI